MARSKKGNPKKSNTKKENSKKEKIIRVVPPLDADLFLSILLKKRRQEQAEYEYAFVASAPLDVTSAQHDFRREMAFMKQAEIGATEVLARLKSLKIPTQVPDDFRAERLKDDCQMKRVTDKLKDKREAIERSEKVRKLRDLKKMGKKIQEEVLRKRQKQKKETLEQISKYKRGEKTNVLD